MSLRFTRHRAAFAAVLDSMRRVEFQEEEIADVRVLLAAVLLIGDIVRPTKRGGGGGVGV